MKLEAVLTGDLIHSQSAGDTLAYISGLKAVLKQLEKRYKAKAETFRGDGFQLSLDRPEQALHCAIALRAALVAASPEGERWDARIAVGIGSAQQSQTYREAFVLSGQGLDNMKKNTLAILSNHQAFQERTELLTEFVAAILEQWTAVEAQTYAIHLIEATDQQSIADALGKSRITVNKALQRAQARLLDKYLAYISRLIGELSDG
ncbi:MULTISPECIES: hypothetical protein [unclassified Pseudomonas]|uniref:hypothetical protein n=1 Tax=unclassified Pseudomonas TaxID=196821 RepID=UPI00091BF991|nr:MULTISPECIES: hypothetical protein [unclassified Pseudomonas]ROO41053.1 hypothetical protein BIV08_14915 [Pseudomonas sp. AF76]SFX02061.1 hypothetical protein SAMN03159309_00250 [Pseudomonas sp. NFACC36]